MEIIRKKQEVINQQVNLLKAAPIYNRIDIAMNIVDLQVDLQNSLIEKIEKLEQKRGSNGKAN